MNRSKLKIQHNKILMMGLKTEGQKTWGGWCLLILTQDLLQDIWLSPEDGVNGFVDDG